MFCTRYVVLLHDFYECMLLYQCFKNVIFGSVVHLHNRVMPYVNICSFWLSYILTKQHVVNVMNTDVMPVSQYILIFPNPSLYIFQILVLFYSISIILGILTHIAQCHHGQHYCLTQLSFRVKLCSLHIHVWDMDISMGFSSNIALAQHSGQVGLQIIIINEKWRSLIYTYNHSFEENVKWSKYQKRSIGFTPQIKKKKRINF